jgi:hypothetical protein
MAESADGGFREAPEATRITAMTTSSAHHMGPLAHDELGGSGNGGEGMAIQLMRGRALTLAHESAPTSVTGADVTEPRKPALRFQGAGAP